MVNDQACWRKCLQLEEVTLITVKVRGFFLPILPSNFASDISWCYYNSNSCLP